MSQLNEVPSSIEVRVIDTDPERLAMIQATCAQIRKTIVAAGEPCWSFPPETRVALEELNQLGVHWSVADAAIEGVPLTFEVVGR